MNRVLDVGYTLNLCGKEFIIKDIVGKGASSVTYLAEQGKTEHILKECNPLGISMHRNEIGELVADSDLSRQKFEECLERFKVGADKQLSFRLVEDLKNPTSNIQDIYYVNGTAYIDMTYFGGKTYDKLDSETLYDLFRRMKALAQIVGHYHKLGYLHLDIKPQNIYTIPETPEMVMMFDFDSVTPINDINAIISSSYTDVWAAPEQKLPKYRNQICEATDLFAIGEIIFFRLFGKHSEENDRYSFSQYEGFKDNKWFENVNPRVCPLITELLHKTLSCSAKKRYQKAEQLALQLDKIIELSNPKEPFLKSSFPNVSGFFTGRDAEIEEIYNRLQDNNVLFLSGIGGIGKSELAKHYADKYKDEYDAIIFAPFVNDVQIMITSDEYVPIYNFHQYPEEKPDEYFERKMRKLGELCDERTLFIVDNLDEAEDKNIGRLLRLGCKMLITTRMDFSDIYPDSQINIAELSNPFDIFNEHYKKPLTEEEQKCVEKIIEIVCGHTMTIELLAKQMMAGRVKPDKMLEKLKNGGISDSGKEKIFHANEKGEISRENTYEHIQALFDLSDLDEDEKNVLANLSLIPHTGISSELFCEWCEIEDFSTINNLAIEGWIRWDKEKDYISVHPVIIGLFQKKIKSNKTLTFISNFSGALINEDTGEVILSDIEFNIANIISNSIIKLIANNQIEPSVDIINDVVNFGIFYWEQGLISRAEKVYCLAREWYSTSSIQDPYLEVAILNNLALLYDSQTELYDNKEFSSKAISLFLECLKIVEKPENNLTEYIGTIYGNLGSSYHSIKDFQNAEKFYKKAISISDNRYNFYTCLGVLYNQTSKFNKSLEMNLKAMEKAILNNDPPLAIATIEHNISASYRKLGLYDDAANHCEKALHIREVLLDHTVSYDLAISKSLLGRIYVEIGSEYLLPKAEKLLNEALISFESIVGTKHIEYEKVLNTLNSFSKKERVSKLL